MTSADPLGQLDQNPTSPNTDLNILNLDPNPQNIGPNPPKTVPKP